jgi:hypothetical protein
LFTLRPYPEAKFVIANDLQVKFVFLKGLGAEICPASGALRRSGMEVIHFRLVMGKFVQAKDLGDSVGKSATGTFRFICPLFKGSNSEGGKWQVCTRK